MPALTSWAWFSTFVPRLQSAIAAQILQSYTIVEPGKPYSYLQALVRGIPKRLAKCKANKFGPCGK